MPRSRSPTSGAANPAYPQGAGRQERTGFRGARGERRGVACSSPTVSNFAGEDAQLLWPRPQQFRVGNTLERFCDSDGGAIASGSKGLGPPLACHRRHERDVATQRLARRSGLAHDRLGTGVPNSAAKSTASRLDHAAPGMLRVLVNFIICFPSPFCDCSLKRGLCPGATCRLRRAGKALSTGR